MGGTLGVFLKARGYGGWNTGCVPAVRKARGYGGWNTGCVPEGKRLWWVEHWVCS